MLISCRKNAFFSSQLTPKEDKIKFNNIHFVNNKEAELLKQADACYVHRMIDGEWNIESAHELITEAVTA